MAEANKCDVVNCGQFSEGAPVAKFIQEGVSKGMCKKHAEALVSSYFPDLVPQPVATVEPERHEA